MIGTPNDMAVDRVTCAIRIRERVPMDIHAEPNSDSSATRNREIPNHVKYCKLIAYAHSAIVAMISVGIFVLS